MNLEIYIDVKIPCQFWNWISIANVLSFPHALDLFFFYWKWIILKKFRMLYICYCIPKKNDSQTHTQELGPPCRNFQICKNSLLLLKKNSSKIWFRARLLNFNIFREAISCEIRTRINLLNFTLVVKKWRVKSFFPSLSPFTTFTSSRVIHFSNALIVRYFDLELWTMHFKTRRRSLDSNSK